MNYADQIAYEVQERESWTDATLLDVVLDYIGNQDSDEAFRDYLTQRSAEDAEDHDWISETLCKCGAQFSSPRSMTAHIEWANAAEVNPCGVPEADTDENGMTWADRCTAEDPCPVRAAQGGLSCGH